MIDSLWSKLLDYVAKEWRVIMQAKLIFGCALFLATVLVWFVINWYYLGIINTQAVEIQDETTMLNLLKGQSSEFSNESRADPSEPQRHLTGAETTCLSNNLGSFVKQSPKLMVFYVRDPEPDVYAYEFLTIFKRLGFNVGGGFADPLDIDSGIVLGLNNIQKPSKNALAFESILTSCGLTVTEEQSGAVGYGPTDFDLFITDQP